MALSARTPFSMRSLHLWLFRTTTLYAIQREEAAPTFHTQLARRYCPGCLSADALGNTGPCGEGLTVLAGRQKIGRVPALNWAIAVACGGLATGSLGCEIGDVLYVDLHNGPRRTRDRLDALFRPSGLKRSRQAGMDGRSRRHPSMGLSRPSRTGGARCETSSHVDRSAQQSGRCGLATVRLWPTFRLGLPPTDSVVLVVPRLRRRQE